MYYNLGLFSLLLGRLEESVSWYEQAVSFNVEQVLEESIGDLEAVLTTRMPEALYLLAFLYEHKRNLSKAVELYEKYLSSNSQYDKYKGLAQSAIERLK
ncbi:MAG: tetratricopeptide repeat protein [Anaerolineae bacterium]|nr:tetratricopeptide repeat protein [Anaerolineae bacterium]